jgi:outer membrane lipoprotein SlyB
MKMSKTTICLALAAALAAGGCASTSDGKLAQAQGTGIGALLGAGLGYAIGGGEGAKLGAALGAAGGFAFGTHIAKRKEQYANAELWLDACIAEANQTNQRAIATRGKLESRLAALQTRADKAVATKNAGEIRKVKAEVASLRGEINKEVGSLEQQQSGFSQVFSDPDAQKSARIGGLRQAVGQIDNHKAAYQGDLRRLAAIDNSLDV